MLQGIRDRAHGFIAWIIVILICIPFALWGVQEYLGPDPNVAVAEVDGDEISLFEYQTALQTVRASLNRQFPGQDVSRIFGEAFIRNRAMEGLVRERLIARASSGAGFVVSDEQVAGAIRSAPAFQRDGAFSTEEYEYALRRSGSSPGRFETDTRRRLLEAQWRDALVLSAAAAENRVRRLAALESQTRAFSRLVVPAGRFAGAEVGEEAIAKRYEENKAAFLTPEEVRLRYVVLSRDDLAADVEIPAGTIEGILRFAQGRPHGAGAAPRAPPPGRGRRGRRRSSRPGGSVACPHPGRRGIRRCRTGGIRRPGLRRVGWRPRLRRTGDLGSPVRGGGHSRSGSEI